MVENEHRLVGRFSLVAVARERTMDLTEMRSPYGLEIIDNCVTCPHREDRLFCNLPPTAVQRLSEITFASSYPKGATLFVEGQNGRGVFILCAGRVKLSTSSIDGRTLIVRLSEPGEVLGLPATVTGTPYELTAEVVEPTQANFIAKEDFLTFLREHGDVALRVAQQLGETYHSAIAEMRTIGLSQSAKEKTGSFYSGPAWWTTNLKRGPSRYKLAFTQLKKLRKCWGRSRETVTRAFADLKKSNFVKLSKDRPSP